ncbi:similar to Saccharomyces cerevisiae YGR078C PAC10 Part of the heteromeric co-chaperone GimC/prefoldin complex, which promotes efficient protein folding [Maudiozyma saulgeensis]|uniref:Prefoldin subunit 3 n=1 Tax=Maudiozyma saulgeensis TaxID=1789683 RepID=A0A1X7R436_9SACH|nr:similar to Saccharomyces cerevisiae YGR078C PAC10 Part of the heteromeric co-chaperone GimC/prefoldin complex, which promotes efficient protein folding [Kazachstania saulgeensis]
MDTIFNSTEKNARGIPAAPFVGEVEEFIKDPNDFDLVFSKFQERLSMYKYMQESKGSTVKQLRVRIPDIEHTLQVCKTLQHHHESSDEDNNEMEVNYQLNDTLYTKASIDTKDTKVGLWLGADVMLEYPVEEAIVLLQERHNAAQKSLETALEDVEFLRENITTMEVNCARLYNWDVERRKALREAEEGTKNLAI